MLDFSWSELLIVLLVAILAIGPKQIPDVLYGLGRIVRRMQYMRFALTRQFDDFMEQSDLRQMQDLTKQMGMPKTSIHDEQAEDEEMVDLPPEPKTDQRNDEPQNGPNKTTSL